MKEFQLSNLTRFFKRNPQLIKSIAGNYNDYNAVKHL